MAMAGLGVGFAVFYLVVILCSILVQIFLPLAIYNDAKAHYSKNTVLFTVLSIFFPLIIGIVYLVLRNKPDQVDYTLLSKNCLGCGAPCNGAEFNCHACGNSQFTELYGAEDTEKRQKKAKGFLIAAIACYALDIIIAVVGGVLIGVASVGMINGML